MQSRTYSKSESMPPQGLFPRLVSPGLASVLPGTPDPAEEALSGLALERLLAELGCGPLTAGPEPHPVIGVRVLRTMTGAPAHSLGSLPSLASQRQASNQSDYVIGQTSSMAMGKTSSMAESLRALRRPEKKLSDWKSMKSVKANGMARASNDDLQEAAMRGDLTLMRRLCAAGASVNAPIRPEGDDEYMSLLHILASKPELPNGPRIMSVVIEYRANLNVRSSLGTTPLARACLTKHMGAVEVLLQAKADASPMDDYGRKAVTYAMLPHPAFPRTEQNRLQQEQTMDDLMHLLARSGASLDDGGDVPPIIHAVRTRDMAAVQSLLSCGAESAGLHDALQLGELDIFAQLVKAEANPFLKDAEGKSVMDVALAKGLDVITTMLRDYIGDLQRKQHRHLRTLEDQMEEEARELEEVGGVNSRRACAQFRPSQTSLNLKDEEKAAGNCGSLGHFCRRVNRDGYFQAVMFIDLLMALFVPDMYIIAGVADAGPLDSILIFILVGFLIEFLVQIIGYGRGYVGTFFFYMDLIGVVSVPLDHSIVVNMLHSGGALDNTVVMRAARMAKLGARAGRFTKLLKLLRFLPGMKNVDDTSTAKVISGHLNQSLSIRVSILIIIMVMLMPCFELITYPENDFSMKLWLKEIADAAAQDPLGMENAFRVAAQAAANRPRAVSSGGFGGGYLDEVLKDCQAFYKDRNYWPFQIKLKDATTGEVVEDLVVRLFLKEPDRKRSIMSQNEGDLAADLNFYGPHKIESISNCLLIIFIIIAMMTAAKLMNSKVSEIVLVPLEELFSKVHSVANDIFKSVNEAVAANKKDLKRVNTAKDADEDEEGEDVFGNETRLLEKVLAKLQTLSQITLEKSPMDADQLEMMSDEDRAVLMGHASIDQFAEPTWEGDETKVEKLQELALERLGQAGLRLEDLWDWNLDVGSMDEPSRHQLVLNALLLHHDAGAASSLAQEEWCRKCSNFVDAAARGYAGDKVPFHSWHHAVDVTATLARLFKHCMVHKFLTETERFSLLVASTCHDIGHEGLNNAFLVASGHELALRYNDRSPLEMYHCVHLFQIARNPGAEIFDVLEKDQRTVARKTIVEAIIFTDTRYHAEMVKELQTIQELSGDLFDALEDVYHERPHEYPSQDVTDFMRRPDVRKLMKRSLLHFCDVAQPLKSWDTCEDLAARQMDEFFRQGDIEKELGLPVQPLNDRLRVSVPYTQVCYIQFLVAPLAMTMAKLMPPLGPSVEVMLENFDTWREMWVEDTDPPPSDFEQARVMERMKQLQEKLRRVQRAKKAVDQQY